MSVSWGAMTWVNQPRQWRWDGPDLHVRTESGSDFWRSTGQGYDHDSGHAFLAREKGDLAIEATVQADYLSQHDQAGLMIRLNWYTWLKAGVQLLDGQLAACVVSTHGSSDWSIAPLALPTPETPVRFRLSRTGNAVRVSCAIDDEDWRVLRLAHFPAAVPVGIGPMCASPHRGGLQVLFSDCDIRTAGPSWDWPGR